MSVEVSAPGGSDEILAYGEIARTSLPFGSISAATWTARQPAEQMRLARVGQEVAGGALLCPMGQYFGGRAVPMVGLNAVAVAPEHRGRGVGSHLMGEILGELAERGVALSCLYPATQPIYRSVGYEQAGTRISYQMPLSAIEDRFRGLDVDRVGMEAVDDLRPLHEARARWWPGSLQRSDWCWSRLLAPPWPDNIAYRVRQDGRTTGYLIARQVFVPGGIQSGQLQVRDLCASTPEARARLWSILADHRSMCESAILPGDLAGGMLLGLREQGAKVHDLLRWMIRITSLQAALSERGYPEAVEASLTLQVDDDQVAANRGTFVLHVHQGRGRVELGSSGSSAGHGHGGVLRAHIRDLAPLYTGHLDARVLAASGRLQADDSTLSTAAAIFGGPAPSMIDFF